MAKSRGFYECVKSPQALIDETPPNREPGGRERKGLERRPGDVDQKEPQPGQTVTVNSKQDDEKEIDAHIPVER